MYYGEYSNSYNIGSQLYNLITDTIINMETVFDSSVKLSDNELCVISNEVIFGILESYLDNDERIFAIKSHNINFIHNRVNNNVDQVNVNITFVTTYGSIFYLDDTFHTIPHTSNTHVSNTIGEKHMLNIHVAPNYQNLHKSRLGKYILSDNERVIITEYIGDNINRAFYAGVNECTCDDRSESFCNISIAKIHANILSGLLDLSDIKMVENDSYNMSKLQSKYSLNNYLVNKKSTIDTITKNKLDRQNQLSFLEHRINDITSKTHELEDKYNTIANNNDNDNHNDNESNSVKLGCVNAGYVDEAQTELDRLDRSIKHEHKINSITNNTIKKSTKRNKIKSILNELLLNKLSAQHSNITDGLDTLNNECVDKHSCVTELEGVLERLRKDEEALDAEYGLYNNMVVDYNNKAAKFEIDRGKIMQYVEDVQKIEL